MSKPFVSVVIPVYNDTERLKLCLEALDAQTYPSDRYEVIVVDNNSDSPLVADELKEFEHVILTHETLQGAAAARNRGISLARGEVIAFTDSDCIPASDWLEKGVAHIIDHPDTGQVGGRVEVFVSDPENPTAVEMWDTILGFPQKFYIENKKFSVTANVFVRKDVINKIGKFDTVFKSAAGEDLEWGNRIHQGGYKLVYADDVVVRHPARSTFGELAGKYILHAGGDYYLETRGNIPSIKRVADIMLHLIPPVVTTVRILRNEKFKKLNGIRSKIMVVGVFWFVRYRTTLEKIRLLLGGKPRSVRI